MISYHGILLVTFICGSQGSGGTESFIEYNLVPDILCQPPDSLITVKFPCGAEVSEGNELTVLQVLTAPSVSWGAHDGVNYTVLMIDPDAPSRNTPILRSFLHWLVINARDDDVTTGHAVAEYISPNPPPGSGPHRYALLVYRQPSELPVKDFLIYAFSRKNFSPEDFADENDLGNAIGGNFFQTKTL